MRINKDDFLKALLSWVIGELYAICAPGRPYHSQMTTAEGEFDHEKFFGFALRVNGVVQKHLLNYKVLDGTCSDMECSLALSAKSIFKAQVDYLNNQEVIRLKESNDLNGAVRLYRQMSGCGLKEAWDHVTNLK